MRSNPTEAGESLVYLPAHPQLELFRQRHLSPVEVLKAQIDRIEAGNLSINAVMCRHFDEALSAATESENRYHRGVPRALEGITVAVKEEYEFRMEGDGGKCAVPVQDRERQASGAR